MIRRHFIAMQIRLLLPTLNENMQMHTMFCVSASARRRKRLTAIWQTHFGTYIHIYYLLYQKLCELDEMELHAPRCCKWQKLRFVAR